MKQTDIDKLKALCEKEGLNFDFDHIDGSALIVREKKEPRVTYVGWDHGDLCNQISFTFEWIGIVENTTNEVGNHLAKCLQEYILEETNKMK